MIAAENFDIKEFIKEHSSEIIIFLVTGKERGCQYYDYRIVRFGEIMPRVKNPMRKNSKRSTALAGAYNAISSLDISNTTIHIVVYESIELNNWFKYQDDDKKAQNNIDVICSERDIRITEVVVFNGEKILPQFVKNKSIVRLTPGVKNKKHANNTIVDKINNKLKTRKIESSAFSKNNFLKECDGCYVVFVSGGGGNKLNHNGWYSYRLYDKSRNSVYEHQNKLYSNNQNDVLLMAILDACVNRVSMNSTLYAVAPGNLGFDNSEKSTNKEHLDKIFKVRDKKQISIYPIHINGGGEAIRRIVHNF